MPEPAEAKDLVALGLSEAEALEEALGVTVVPFCCSLEEGEPDIAAVKALEITLQDVLKACKVAKVA